MADEMISHCGLICTRCDAYLATRTMDADRAAEVAAAWSRQFQIQVEVEHVWCDGCLVGGRKCAHCGECEIRACAMERGVANCGRCEEFACERLEAFFGMVPQARATLEAIRAG